jgi:hypothetical protein
MANLSEKTKVKFESQGELLELIINLIDEGIQLDKLKSHLEEIKGNLEK